jgi:hypothetical protein
VSWGENHPICVLTRGPWPLNIILWPCKLASEMIYLQSCHYLPITFGKRNRKDNIMENAISISYYFIKSKRRKLKEKREDTIIPLNSKLLFVRYISSKIMIHYLMIPLKHGLAPGWSHWWDIWKRKVLVMKFRIKFDEEIKIEVGNCEKYTKFLTTFWCLWQRDFNNACECFS